jgi:hypothetical protein
MRHQTNIMFRIAICLMVVFAASSCKLFRSEAKNERALRLLTSDDSGERREGLIILYQLPQPLSVEIMPMVIDLLEDGEPDIRCEATCRCWIRARRGAVTDAEAALMVPRLAAFLGDSERVCRDMSCTTLRLLGPRAIEAMDALRDQFETTEDQQFRSRCAIAMDIIAPGSMQEHVLRAVRDPIEGEYILSGLYGYLESQADRRKIELLATAMLDAFEAEIQRSGDDLGGEAPSLLFSTLEDTLVLFLAERPYLMETYNSYLGRGIDSYLERIIEEATSTDGRRS